MHNHECRQNLRHCTEMSVQENYVDTHGQSEVGLTISHLLGFSLMPRLANLNKQKLAQCELGDYQKYKNLQPVLTQTINWQLTDVDLTNCRIKINQGKGKKIELPLFRQHLKKLWLSI
ncbi:TPA: Tn3 family transposase [Legionella pneumophila]